LDEAVVEGLRVGPEIVYECARAELYGLAYLRQS
jgi:hypothetical protein